MKKENTVARTGATAQIQEEYPSIQAISYWIGYGESLLAILAEPLLIICAAIAVIDFITGGSWTEVATVRYLWAGSLAISVTASFIVTCRRSILAFSVNAYGRAIALALLAVALGFVDWAAVDVQSLQQTMSLSFASALEDLGLNIVWLTHLRSGVAVAMAVVVAVSNHVQVTSARAPRRRVTFFARLLDRFAPVVPEEPEVVLPEPPAVPEEPEVVLPEPPKTAPTTEKRATRALPPEPREGGQRAAIKDVMRGHLHDGHKLNLRAIAREAHTGYSTVKKHARAIQTELAAEPQG